MATAKLTLTTATAAMVSAAIGVDTAVAGAEADCNVWFRFVAKRMIGDKPSLTIDDVETALVAACMAKATKAQAKEIARASDLARNGFPTAYHWFRMLVRIHAAKRLVDAQEKAESGKGYRYTLNTLGKAVPAIQPKAARKGKATTAKGKATTTAPATAPVAAPATTGWKDVRAFLVNVRKGKALPDIVKHEADLSVIVAEAGNIVRLLEAHRKAQAKAKAIGKAAPAKRTRRAA